MKKALSILFVLILSVSAASSAAYAADTSTTWYFDSETGSDDNSGTSETSPFKTLAKFNTLTLAAGDKVLFKCGGTFEGTIDIRARGTADAPVVISTYGEGDKPYLFSNAGDDSEMNSEDDIPTHPIIVEIIDSSYVEFGGMRISAPHGQGLYVRSVTGDSDHITVSGCEFCNIKNFQQKDYSMNNMGCLIFSNDAAWSGVCVHDITVSSCEFHDCSYGLSSEGAGENNGTTKKNYNLLVTGCSFHDLWDDALIMTSADNFDVVNTSIIDTCLSTLYYTAPVWLSNCTGCEVSGCEIAGTLNYLDGMTIDFDEKCDGCTYEYLYSHDNFRFFWAVARQAGNNNNTVRYCLSVNDSYSETGNGTFTMDTKTILFHNFKIYNNTIVDSSYWRFSNLTDSYICNNIFVFVEDCYQNHSSYYVDYGKHSNTVESNLYYLSGYSGLNNADIHVPDGDNSANSKAAEPLFVVPDDSSSKDNYKLFADSPAIGKGVKVEADMGSKDFYGNPVTADMVHNIGCYEGAGISRPEPVTTTVPVSVSEPVTDTSAPATTQESTGEFSSAGVSVSEVPSSEDVSRTSADSTGYTVPSGSSSTPSQDSSSSEERSDEYVYIVLGDVDRDFAVTAADARLALRAAVGLEQFTHIQLLCGDVTFNGRISAADARLILRAAVGLELLKKKSV